MRPVIVEIRGSYAAALTEDGSIIRIKNRNYSVGQQIEIPVASHAVTKKLLAMAACLVLILSGLTTYAYFSPYSYVSIDVNPSLEFTLNRFDFVLSAEGVNDDGKALTQDINTSSMKNRSINYAFSLTINEMLKSGYLNPQLGGGIVIATSANNEKKAASLAVKLKEALEDKLVEDINSDEIPNPATSSPVPSDAPSPSTMSPKISPSKPPESTPDNLKDSPPPGRDKDQETKPAKGKIVIESVDVSQEYVDRAKEKGVTPGKLHLVEKLQESASADDVEIDIDLWLSKSVKDIMKTTQEYKREQRELYDASDDHENSGESETDNSQSGKPVQQSKSDSPKPDKPGNNHKTEKDTFFNSDNRPGRKDDGEKNNPNKGDNDDNYVNSNFTDTDKSNGKGNDNSSNKDNKSDKDNKDNKDNKSNKDNKDNKDNKGNKNNSSEDNNGSDKTNKDNNGNGKDNKDNNTGGKSTGDNNRNSRGNNNRNNGNNGSRKISSNKRK